MKNEDNERIEEALKWCEKNKVKRTEQLSLFAKLAKKKKKLDKKEFEQMCKKARVDRKSLAKTVFTRSISST